MRGLGKTMMWLCRNNAIAPIAHVVICVFPNYTQARHVGNGETAGMVKIPTLYVIVGRNITSMTSNSFSSIFRRV